MEDATGNMTGEASSWVYRVQKKFSSQRPQAAHDSDLQRQLLPCKGSWGECLLILNLFFLSQDLESYVAKPYADGHPKSPLPLELAHGCLSGHQERSQI